MQTLPPSAPPTQIRSRPRFLPIVQGYKMHRVFTDGDEVCAIYDFKVATPAGAGSIAMTEDLR